MQDQGKKLGPLDLKRLFPLTPEMVRRLLGQQDAPPKSNRNTTLDRDAAR